ncbi:MAG: hypothetical protein ACK4XJ_05080 [Fimbriimonadaceae bacterium]
MDRAREGGILVALMFAMVGCRASAPIPYASYAPPKLVETPSEGYLGMVQIAKDIGIDNEAEVRLTSYTVPGKKRIFAELETAIQRTETLLREPVRIAYEPIEPFSERPYRAEWRLLGRAIAWRAEYRGAVGDYDGAVRDVLTATRLGFFLTSGDAADASLGYSIIAASRKAMAPFLVRMEPETLERLGRGLEGALVARPPIEVWVDHEHASMKLAVDRIQEWHRAGRLDLLREKLGPNAREALAELASIRPESKKRAEYFDRLAERADSFASDARTRGRLPLAEREPEPSYPFGRAKDRAILRNFFGAPRYLLPVVDQELARTQLLAIEALVLAQIKRAGAAPRSLEEFSETLTLDPYSGDPFVYRADRAEYRLYSVGQDLKDDGGETDDLGTQPDLRWEGAGL